MKAASRAILAKVEELAANLVPVDCRGSTGRSGTRTRRRGWRVTSNDDDVIDAEFKKLI